MNKISRLWSSLSCKGVVEKTQNYLFTRKVRNLREILLEFWKFVSEGKTSHQTPSKPLWWFDEKSTHCLMVETMINVYRNEFNGVMERNRYRKNIAKALIIFWILPLVFFRKFVIFNFCSRWMSTFSRSTMSFLELKHVIKIFSCFLNLCDICFLLIHRQNISQRPPNLPYLKNQFK